VGGGGGGGGQTIPLANAMDMMTPMADKTFGPVAGPLLPTTPSHEYVTLLSCTRISYALASTSASA
jgi:hypothetical protein